MMMQEIASAAREQSTGIEQVNTAVTQMDEMTQQNAALVEEASAAGQAMSDQARGMNKVVEFFSNADSHGFQPPTRQTTSSGPAPSLSKKPAEVPNSRQEIDMDDDEWEEFQLRQKTLMGTAATKQGEFSDREFPMTDKDFCRIKDLTFSLTGITLSDHKRNMVYGRLARRLRRLGMQQIQKVTRNIERQKNEAQKIKNNENMTGRTH
eukprot:TRINITY_DN7467_c1_g1_i1.p1 TRINITY_DN7467_c1_g1~~TRINITY_DN7467_c1_g1_i1.p1  ORF type:complete len:242 (+),score=12.04 TRINITY_DN7467_c1_g1_i1:105-728(+)